MTKQPAPSNVSLVITTFNHARFLSEAIESAAAQTVSPQDIIVVDDGSTDDTPSVIGRYPHVKYIRQDNQGLAAARNTGLHAATGKYIAFLDADDRLRPNAIEANLMQFNANPDCGFVYGAYSYIDESGKHLQNVRLRPASPDAFRAFLSGNLVGMHATVLYRRDRLMEAGGFDRTLPACEDYDVYLRLSRLHPVASVEDCLADYRRHDSNMSNNIPLMLDTALKVLGRRYAEAGTRSDWAAAYRDGAASWKKYYAEKQVGQLVAAMRTKSSLTRQALNSAMIARIAARALARALKMRLVRRHRSGKLRGKIGFGDLERTTPFSTEFGFDRGKPVDRRYVEAFLAAQSTDIRGRVLEIGDNAYTRLFGGDRVERSDVLNRYAGRPSTTFVGDLTEGAALPSETFDCIILTQTLHLLFDMPAAIATIWRVLKPGGTLLVTVPWVSSIDRGEWRNDWCWSITPNALERLLSTCFAGSGIEVRSYGNVYSAAAFLYGLAESELRGDLLDANDPCCPVIVAARAQKGAK